MCLCPRCAAERRSGSEGIVWFWCFYDSAVVEAREGLVVDESLAVRLLLDDAEQRDAEVGRSVIKWRVRGAIEGAIDEERQLQC